MSYVVLARKYRPFRFEDMVGQEHVGRTLGNAIRQNRVHHAYLFAGARGLGKTTTARIFAKGLVCEQGPTATPCNECTECVAVNEGRSVDVLEIDGASNNSVENIRNLREQVHYLPQSARRKVYIIDEVHMLTTSAFNALLKTLEEPPAHVNFVFATTEPQKVLATILSRVSRLDFRRVSPEETTAHLISILEREGAKIDAGGLRLIARASGGSVRDALTLTDQVIAFSDDPTQVTEAETRGVLGQADTGAVADLVDAVLDRDPDAVVARYDELVTAGLDLMVLSMQLLEHLRDLTLVKVCRGRGVLKGATDSEYEALRKQASKTGALDLCQLFDRFTRVVDRLPASRVQRLLLEMALLELAHSEPLVPLGDLVDRLQALGSGAPGPGGGAGPSGGRGPSPSGSPQRRTQASPGTSAHRPSTGAPPQHAAESQPSAHAQRVAQSATEAPTAPLPTSPPRTAIAPQQQTPRTPAVETLAVETPATDTATDAPATDTPAAPGSGFGDSELMRGLWSMAKEVVKKPEPAAVPGPEGPTVTNGGPTATASADVPAATARDACSPCSERPPRQGVIQLDETPEFDAWEQLVARIRKEDEYVSAVLSQVGLVQLKGGLIKIASPLQSFPHIELTSRPEIRSQIEQAARDHLGRPFQVELVEAEPNLLDCPSIVLMEAQRRENFQRRVESEANEHTGIRTLLSTFNGTLAGTKALKLPPKAVTCETEPESSVSSVTAAEPTTA